MFKVGDIVDLEITSVGSAGEGVGKVDGFAVFVARALPGEKIKARLTLVKKSYATGKLLEINQKSPHRQRPVCEVFYKCGGCQLQHLDYSGQLKIKEQQVRDALERIGKFSDVQIFPVLADKQPLNYRNKMQCPVASQDGLKLGFYEVGSHKVVDVRECHIQNQVNNTILTVVRDWIRKFRISVYNEQTGKGLVRHVLGRVSSATGEVMAGIVCTQKSMPHKEELIEMLKLSIPNITSVVQNINSRRTNVILGDITKVLYGKESIADKIGEFTFQIAAKSFFQVNTKQAEVLYKTALDYAQLTGEEQVVDLYCGIGTISLFLAKQAKKVWGIEIVDVAVEDAKINAKANGIENVEFFKADVNLALEKISKKTRLDVVVLDPPRAGCDKALLDTIVNSKPKRVVYVSCNPATLARDLRILVDSGLYELVKVQPVDMFGQTSHVETVVLMSRVNN